jgi:hypothetical protein
MSAGVLAKQFIARMFNCLIIQLHIKVLLCAHVAYTLPWGIGRGIQLLEKYAAVVAS